MGWIWTNIAITAMGALHDTHDQIHYQPLLTTINHK